SALPEARAYVAVESSGEGLTFLGGLRARGLGSDRVRLIETGQPLTAWARDPTLPVIGLDGGVTLWSAPESSLALERSGDYRFAARLAEHSRGAFIIQRSDLMAEGGNVLSTGRRVLIGANSARHNLSLPDDVPSVEHLTQRLEDVFGLPVAMVGDGTNAPHEHLDMYVTLLDDRRALVADSSAGSAILQGAGSDVLAGWEAMFASDSSAVYSGRPFSLADRLERGRDAGLALALTRVARHLERLGFDVIRVPAVLAGINGGYPILTYNNVLLEQRDGQQRVLMPVYGLAPLDSAAADAWSALGYVVHSIDVSNILDLEGAVRCLTQVLRRGPRPDVTTP
ncbi:MAG: N-dimethylarginine dimethylaminohydrolase, partial [Myxococcota bacterium]